MCLGIPLVLLTAGYCWLAIDHGTFLLWNTTVHESGKYTLGETIFYFSHFLREIPTDVAYALFTFAGFIGVKRCSGGSLDRRRSLWLAKATLTAACALIAGGFGFAVRDVGLSSALYDLLQFHTRDGMIAYGSHWHFHWLSTLWFGVIATLAAPVIAGLFGVPTSGIEPQAQRWWWITWGYFAGMTMIFGLSSEIFENVRYTGHQAREILTHGPIMLLLAFGTLHLSAQTRGHAMQPLNLDLQVLVSTPRALTSLVIAVAIPVFLAVVTFSGNVMEAGQSEYGLASMVGAHFFEHVLDYFLVVFLAVGIYHTWVAQQTPEGQGCRP